VLRVARCVSHVLRVAPETRRYVREAVQRLAQRELGECRRRDDDAARALMCELAGGALSDGTASVRQKVRTLWP
jgi:hypothetical protein